jgi:hypothetical protein
MFPILYIRITDYLNITTSEHTILLYYRDPRYTWFRATSIYVTYMPPESETPADSAQVDEEESLYCGKI